jgi:hypothetical protein
MALALEGSICAVVEIWHWHLEGSSCGIIEKLHCFEELHRNPHSQ